MPKALTRSDGSSNNDRDLLTPVTLERLKANDKVVEREYREAIDELQRQRLYLQRLNVVQQHEGGKCSLLVKIRRILERIRNA